MQVQKVIKHSEHKRSRLLEAGQASNFKLVSAKSFVYDMALNLH